MKVSHLAYARRMFRMRYFLTICLVAVFAMGATSAVAARKALVIGNDAYVSFGRLKNAVQDARDVANALRAAKFEVPEKWLILNGGRERMDTALQDFVGNLDQSDEVVFYFSGHGVEIDGQAALLPIDLKDPTRRPIDGSLRKLDEVNEAKRQVLHESITFNRVAADIAARGVRFSLLIADACRDNPVLELLKRAHEANPSKSAAGQPSSGIIADRLSDTQVFVFSASRGEKALDRLGPEDTSRNGVFTRVLLEAMASPGLSLRNMLRMVTDRVPKLAATYRPNGIPWQQTPVTRAAYIAPEFYFLKPSGPTPGQLPSLTVSTEPQAASVRIRNGPSYFAGMVLEPGNYEIEVSNEGFKSESRWVAMNRPDQTERFSLQPCQQQRTREVCKTVEKPVFGTVTQREEIELSFDFNGEHDYDWRSMDEGKIEKSVCSSEKLSVKLDLIGKAKDECNEEFSKELAGVANFRRTRYEVLDDRTQCRCKISKAFRLLKDNVWEYACSLVIPVRCDFQVKMSRQVQETVCEPQAYWVNICQ